MKLYRAMIKHVLDGFLSHAFLGKALCVPGACSPCSHLFSTLDKGDPRDLGNSREFKEFKGIEMDIKEFKGISKDFKGFTT